VYASAGGLLPGARYTTYPVAPLTLVHARSIPVVPLFAAVKPVGADREDPHVAYVATRA